MRKCFVTESLQYWQLLLFNIFLLLAMGIFLLIFVGSLNRRKGRNCLSDLSLRFFFILTFLQCNHDRRNLIYQFLKRFLLFFCSLMIFMCTFIVCSASNGHFIANMLRNYHRSPHSSTSFDYKYKLYFRKSKSERSAMMFHRPCYSKHAKIDWKPIGGLMFYC